MDNDVTVTFSGDASNLVQSIESVRQATQAWQSVFAPIDRAFAGSIRGIIQGTQTVQQALARMEVSLIASFAESAEKSATSWIASELAKTTATQAGTAARGAAGDSANATSLAQIAENALQAIGAAAAQAFAGVYAFLSPELGPAAAAPAEAAQATVLAAAGSVPGLAVGAWEVPADMLAMVHRGESVVPRDFASGLRAAAPGAGTGARTPAAPSANFTIRALDGASVRRVLADNHGAVAGALRRAWRQGNAGLR